MHTILRNLNGRSGTRAVTPANGDESRERSDAQNDCDGAACEMPRPWASENDFDEVASAKFVSKLQLEPILQHIQAGTHGKGQKSELRTDG